MAKKTVTITIDENETESNYMMETNCHHYELLGILEMSILHTKSKVINSIKKHGK